MTKEAAQSIKEMLILVRNEREARLSQLRIGLDRTFKQVEAIRDMEEELREFVRGVETR